MPNELQLMNIPIWQKNTLEEKKVDKLLFVNIPLGKKTH